MCSNGVRGGASGGIFLIGLGLIFWLNLDVFPWILLVIGAAYLPGKISSEHGLWSRLHEYAWVSGLIWLVGLAILFATDTFWPGILILIGLSTIGGALFRAPDFVKEKRKRDEPWAGLEKPKRDFFTQGDPDEDNHWNEAEPVPQHLVGRD